MARGTKVRGHPSHISVGLAGLRQEVQGWIDFGLALLPWPASIVLGWLLGSGAKRHIGRAPQAPKSVAIIIPDAPRDAAFTRSLAQCILWMAEAGLCHISVYDPRGGVDWEYRTVIDKFVP